MSFYKNAYANEGNWYKGNLHSHSSISDGQNRPEDLIREYKENGYDFLSITDHNIYSDFSNENCDGFLTIPGVERDIFVTGEIFKLYHILGIDNSLKKKNYLNGEVIEKPEWTGINAAQAIIDDLEDHSNFVILAHPVWSRTELSDIIDLKNLIGIEIYNHVCDLEWQHGYSELYWDSLLRHGIKVWGFATDDTHENRHKFGGWIVVKAKELTLPAISEALLAGSFYSSTGPEIFNFYVNEKEVVVECSPVQTINFITYDNLGRCYYKKDEVISNATHFLNGCEKYVRVEITDTKGKKAWSNPIFFD